MKKDLLVLAFVALLVVVLCKGVKIQSVEEYYLTHADDITEDSETVTLMIHCETLLDHYDKLPEKLKDEKYVPSDGVILESKEYVLRKDDTAFDILKRATQFEQIHMESQGANENAYSSVYIQGINYIYEFSCGPLSGWMFRLNGEYPGVGISNCHLQDGDFVELVYTCDLGRDIGGGYEEEEKNSD